MALARLSRHKTIRV